MSRPKLLEKPCHRCWQVLPRDAFSYRNIEKDYRHQYCKPCMVAINSEWASKNRARINANRRALYTPEEGRRRNLTRYGMTPEQYEEMLAGQGGVCAICKTFRAWRNRNVLHIDHDHTTGRVRGLLCHWCNVAIGSLNESPDTLRAAIAYLEQANSQETISRQV